MKATQMRQQFENAKRRKAAHKAAHKTVPTKHCNGYHKCENETYDPKCKTCKECEVEQKAAEVRKNKL